MALIRCLVIGVTLLLSTVLCQDDDDHAMSNVNCGFISGGLDCDCNYSEEVKKNKNYWETK